MTFFIIILSIAITALSIKKYFDKKYLLFKFKKNNVIVYGRRGCGKDLLFQYVINERKEPYISNINYGGDYQYTDIKDLSLGNNTNFSFISGEISLVTKEQSREARDCYVSDVNVYLPSQYDTKLHSIFPSFASYYQLSRHLYNSNIHVNTQSLSRVWKALREQGDCYIHCIESRKGIFGITIKGYIYDRYDSALKEITPLKKIGIIWKQGKLAQSQFNSSYGEVKKFKVTIPYKKIHYDTRVFHEKVFGYPYIQKSKKDILKKCKLRISSIFKKNDK